MMDKRVHVAPYFDLLAFAEPYLRRFWLRKGPTFVAHEANEGMLDVADLGLTLPYRLRRLMGHLERGEVTLTTRHEGREDPLSQINRIANRLAVSILTATLLVSLALLILVYHPPGWEVWGGWFAGMALLVVSMLGVGLIGSIWRSRP